MLRIDIRWTHKSEVPNQIGVRERSNESTRSAINVDVDRKSLFFVLLANQLVHLFDILVLASVGGTKNTTDKDGVFVDWCLIMSNCDALEKSACTYPSQ